MDQRQTTYLIPLGEKRKIAESTDENPEQATKTDSPTKGAMKNLFIFVPEVYCESCDISCYIFLYLSISFCIFLYLFVSFYILLYLAISCYSVPLHHIKFFIFFPDATDKVDDDSPCMYVFVII